MTVSQHAGFSARFARFAVMGALVVLLAGCNLFGQPKIKEEPIIAPDVLYQQALGEMDKYANYRIGKFPEAILAADRYLALYPSSKEVPYVIYLKGNSYFGQIKDITRDQQISKDAIDTYGLLIANYPDSQYAKDAGEKMVIGVDQLAGKEMSVGRYYLGTGNYPAAINRFRTVAEQFQTSTHIEEALYRLAEANLALGLISEAQTAAAVLGHNYPQSTWYKQAFDLLAKQGVSPQINAGSSLARLQQN